MTHLSIHCPECEAAAFEEVSYKDSFEYNGKPFEVRGLLALKCGSCGYQLMAPSQIRHNEQLIDAARRKARGRVLMAASEIRSLRERLGLTQQQASDLFGGGKNAFSKYERGVVIQSEAMDSLMRLLDRHRDLIADLNEFSGNAVDELPKWQPSKSASGGATVIRISDHRRLPGNSRFHVAQPAANAEWLRLEAL